MTDGILAEVAGVSVLLSAVVLLVVALGLQRVARGSAIADNISYVVGACVCLGSAALARWVVRFVSQGLTSEQITLSSDLLTLAAIVLFCVYFFRVRAALSRFLQVAKSGDAALARAHAGEVPRGDDGDE
jgi:uncharacterized membrane protein